MNFLTVFNKLVENSARVVLREPESVYSLVWGSDGRHQEAALDEDMEFLGSALEIVWGNAYIMCGRERGGGMPPLEKRKKVVSLPVDIPERGTGLRCKLEPLLKKLVRMHRVGRFGKAVITQDGENYVVDTETTLSDESTKLYYGCYEGAKYLGAWLDIHNPDGDNYHDNIYSLVVCDKTYAYESNLVIMDGAAKLVEIDQAVLAQARNYDRLENVPSSVDEPGIVDAAAVRDYVQQLVVDMGGVRNNEYAYITLNVDILSVEWINPDSTLTVKN